MQLDPNNPVVRLCIEGMACEQKGEFAKARALFEKAWADSADAFDACVAAHYVARHQDTPAEGLRWNKIALDRALEADAEAVRGFFASLYLNLGKSHEDLGQLAEAGEFYRLAQATIDVLPEGAYRDMVTDGVTRGLERVAQSKDT
jgi:tetratricopeptide (TPR) repeat protein